MWARTPGAATFQLVVVARTDRAGYFSADRPRDAYDEAFGLVSGSTEKQPVALVDGQMPQQLVFAVVVAPPEKKDDSGCSCDAPVPDVADPVDLVRSPASFSADLGGTCVTLTTPNRAIEERSYYAVVRTTEPLIKGIALEATVDVPPNVILLADRLAAGGTSADVGSATANTTSGPSATASRMVPAATTRSVRPDVLSASASSPDGFSSMHLAGAARMTDFDRLKDILGGLTRHAPGRSTLNAKNPVAWDDAPTFYQATTIAHGHLLHFKQVWRANGYSLGDLLYSLPLAPCEKKQIAIVDWTRRDVGARSDQTTETEALIAGLSHDRDVNEVVNTVLNESMRGGSSSSNWGVAAGLGVAGSGGIGILNVGGLFGASGGGGGSSSSAWQDSSKDIAANSLQSLRDQTAQAASSVRNQRTSVIQTVAQGETARVETSVVHNHNHCHSLTIEYFEVLRHLLVTQELVDVQECLFIPLLMSAFDGPKALRWRETLEQSLRKTALLPGFDAIDRILSGYAGSDLPLTRYADETVTAMWGEVRIVFYLRRPKGILEKDAESATFNSDAWLPYKPFMLGWMTPRTFWETYLQALDPDARDAAFQRYAAPQIAEAFVQALSFGVSLRDGSNVTLPLHGTLEGPYAPDTPLAVSIRQTGTLPTIARADILAFLIQANQTLNEGSKVVVQDGTVSYTTAHMRHALLPGWSFEDDLAAPAPVGGPIWLFASGLTAPAYAPTPLDAEEQRNPRAEDEEKKRLLLTHLNEHLEYYHKAIWWNMDPNRRFMLLDGFDAPNSDGRSVASVVENRIIGIVGNSLVMPVARGFHLDPTYTVDPDHPSTLLQHYAPLTPIDPVRISLPTRGVFAEAVAGSCNACEKKDDSRFWRYEESPCGDEPTPIATPSTDTRGAQSNLQPSPLPAPIVAFQNAPPAPQPTGLASALSVLGAQSPFPNVTGLDRTQQNALASFQTAMQGAEYFGGQAAQLSTIAGRLAQQQQATNSIDKTMQTIDQAQTSGSLTGDQANALKESAIKQMISGSGTPTKSDLQTISDAMASGMISQDQAQGLTTSALRRMVSGSGDATLTDSPTVKDLIASGTTTTGSSVTLVRGPESVTVDKTGASASYASTKKGPSAPGSGFAKGVDFSGLEVKDWSKVVAETIDGDPLTFVIMQATSGTTGVTAHFVKNWTDAHAVDIVRGAYRWFYPTISPIDQANHFADTLVKLEAGDLPPICDLEWWKNKTAADIAEVRAWLATPGNKKIYVDNAKAFAAQIKTRLGQDPVFYTGVGFWAELGNPSDLNSFPIWVADYNRSADPRVPPPWGKDWYLWQYKGYPHSSDADQNVPSIGWCDLNVFAGSTSDLRASVGLV